MDSWNTQHKFNCYAYAVSGEQCVPRDNLPIAPGLVGGYRRKSEAPHEIRKALEADGLVLAKSNNPDFPSKREGFYLIAVYSDTRPQAYSPDFHFVRQNADGTWSHKRGFNIEPAHLNLTENNVSGLHNAVSADCAQSSGGLNFDRKYNLIAFCYVPEKGLTMDKGGWIERIAEPREGEIFRGGKLALPKRREGGWADDV